MPEARHHQRVAVGLRLRDQLRAEIGVGAGAVDHHEALAEPARQPVGEHARQHVGAAAGGERHHDLDRARGVLVLGQRGRAEERECEQCARGAGQGAVMPFAFRFRAFLGLRAAPVNSREGTLPRLPAILRLATVDGITSKEKANPHDRLLCADQPECAENLHHAGGDGTALHRALRRRLEGRAVQAGLSEDQPEQQDPGDRRPRRSRRQALHGDRVGRDPDVSRREVRPLPAEGHWPRATRSSSG